ncbi:hypothetical protein QX776_11270 [Alteromonadaceae bacterium BrNp21-10]|nr:hypothetical protein [Alteromonadaceae bacterium BrNp21-10]
MSFSVASSVNSAILSGTFGLQKASKDISQTSFSIAQQTATLKDTNTLLADAATQQLGITSHLISASGRGDDFTSNLLSLSSNLRNAQASSNVLGVAKNVVGKIIDELA